ncbi:hypothetical protein C4544_05185 [candidate division WS5 bacterium]|uniref:Uncharacterized protein n=1 Tax=candidate division WS5 bacterium TaxID=2093353 RepID=A0A419DBE1_9BACT|nr:MAG: hypothetical protein C4544_05185 [candidate division WS5 bacterium]
MATINNKPYSSPRNINLKDGILRFAATQSSNPLDSSSNGLYVNSSNQLIFSAQGAATVLGTTGGAGNVPSWDAIFQGDQTMQLGGLATFTIDRNSGNNNVLTITNTGAGSGHLIQITNAGTGKDIRGDSGTWDVSKAGDATFNTITLSGDAGSNSFSMTAGDVVLSDGSVAITDADNAATFSVTNNTATSASVVVIAGSGIFTGSTTTSFMTVTASGLTTGTVLYMPAAALTTGKVIDVVGNAVTSGILVNISSSAAGTQLTGAGRLLKVDHTGAATGTGIIAEIASAAADETDIFKITASAGLTGGALVVSASSLATGAAIEAADLDSLTSGIGLHIASAATAIAGAGRLVYVNHTGTTSTSGILVEIASAAADETVAFKLTASAALTGVVADFSAVALQSGKVIDISDLDAITTGKAIHVDATGVTQTSGILVHLDSAGTAITGAGRIFLSDHTGTTSTSGIMNEFKSAATDETVIVKITASAALALGVALQVSGASITTGDAIDASDLNALTTGIGLHIASSATAITGAGRLVYVNHTGATSTSGILNEFASAANDETVIVKITASDVLAAGVALQVSGASITTGDAIDVSNLNGLTTGKGLDLASTSAAWTSGNLISAALTSSSATLATPTGAIAALSYSITGTATSGTVSPTNSVLTISGTMVQNGAGGTLAPSGALLSVVGVSTQTAGTLTDTRTAIQITVPSGMTGAPIRITQSNLTSTNYRKLMTESATGISVWMGNGTTANGNLSGTAGDILINGGSNKPEYCTGTTNWTALV